MSETVMASLNRICRCTDWRTGVMSWNLPALMTGWQQRSEQCSREWLVPTYHIKNAVTVVNSTILRRLQSVLHAAAWLITGIWRFYHITPTLRDTLHWLPISQRITFKIALMVSDCSRGRCPKYFSDVYIPVHTVTARSHLRSADHGDLVVPRVLSRFGCHSFRVSGPTIWNDLPVDIRSTDITCEQFKHSLKIWLFECAYGRRRVWETVQSEGAPKK